MQRYTVLDVRALPTGTKVCMRDEAGGYHVARSLAELPWTGLQLQGSEAAPGFGLLTGIFTGQVFRFSFEEVDCSQAGALTILHG